MTRSYDELTARLRAAALSPGQELVTIGEFRADDRDYPLFLVQAGAPGEGNSRVMIAAGIHGDEPAGVEAALRFLETDARDPALLSRFSFVVFPCNNPTGWERNTRENWRGIDLNRQFLAPHPEPEVELLMKALQGRCFDLVFEMHEDIDSPGLYLYEIAENANRHAGEAIIESARAAGCPINTAPEIEGLGAEGGIIRRRIRLRRFRRTRLPQAIYAFRTCGGHVITLEPPASALPLEARVEIELTSLRIALDRTALSNVKEPQ